MPATVGTGFASGMATERKAMPATVGTGFASGMATERSVQ